MDIRMCKYYVKITTYLSMHNKRQVCGKFYQIKHQLFEDIKKKEENHLHIKINLTVAHVLKIICRVVNT